MRFALRKCIAASRRVASGPLDGVARRCHAMACKLLTMAGMQITRDLRGWLRRRDDAPPIEVEAATALWGAVLDEAVDDLEIGALLGAQAVRGESREELAGLMHAVSSRLPAWRARADGRCVCVPAYGALEGEAAWIALCTALLRRFGIAVVVHGTIDSPDAVSPASVLRELGIPPCASLAQAAESVAAFGVAFVPVQLFSPGLGRLLAMRSRLGLENGAHRVAPMIAPAGPGSVCLAFSGDEQGAAAVGAMALEGGADTLSLLWPAGRAPHLSVRPRIERIAAGLRERLFEADGPDCRVGNVPTPADASGIARWIERLARGVVPVPVPALNVVAACLYAVGHAADFNRAKAITALQAGLLASEARA